MPEADERVGRFLARTESARLRRDHSPVSSWAQLSVHNLGPQHPHRTQNVGSRSQLSVAPEFPGIHLDDEAALSPIPPKVSTT